MRTDQMQDGLIRVPEIIPPRVKRESGIHQRLLEKLGKTKNFLQALNFARELISYGTKKKAVVKSVMMQHRLSTRQARQAIKDAKPKKHRARS